MYETMKTSLALLLVLLLMPAAGAHETFVIDPSQMPMVTRRLSQTQVVQGSGVIVAPGVILSAQHLLDPIDRQRPIWIYLPSRDVQATVACLSHPNTDAVLLRADIPSAHNHPVTVNDARPALGEEVVIAGWPKGRWTIMRSTVTVYRQNERLDIGGVITEVGWIPQNLGGDRYAGFSGSGVFDESGALRGFVCCIHPNGGAIGMVPIRHVLQACSLN